MRLKYNLMKKEYLTSRSNLG